MKLMDNFREAFTLPDHPSCVEWLYWHVSGYNRTDGEMWTMLRHPAKGLKPCLCVHTDTVFPKPPRNIRLSKDGTIRGIGSPPGADDRCGLIVAAMAAIEGIETDIALFDLEENDAKGARSMPESEFNGVSIWIGLDRHGEREWVDYGCKSEKVDDIFRSYAPMREKKVGSFSDCLVLSSRSGIACANMSVGFFKEHLPTEYGTMNGILWAVRDLMSLVPALSGKIFDGRAKDPH